MNSFDAFILIEKSIESKFAELFYDAKCSRKSCVIGDVVLSFEEQEEGSFVVRYQNLSLLWVRETPGWEIVSKAIATIKVDEDADSSAIRRRIYESLCHRLEGSLSRS